LWGGEATMTGVNWIEEGSIAITIHGMPRPQGSMTPFRNKHTGKMYVKSADVTKVWRSAVTSAAREAAQEDHWIMLTEMVVLTVSFHFHRPKATPKWRREVEPKWNGSDLDKLVRAIGDGLTDAGIYQDDRQIQRIRATKNYTDGPERAEVYVKGYRAERKIGKQ